MFNIDQVLSAKYVHAKPHGTSIGKLKVYIPVLMPHITMGTPKITPVGLNATCYANASDCKPTIASKIDTQNYVTALAPYGKYDENYYKYGSDIAVIAKTADCLSCKLSPGDSDNSIKDPNRKGD